MSMVHGFKELVGDVDLQAWQLIYRFLSSCVLGTEVFMVNVLEMIPGPSLREPMFGRTAIGIFFNAFLLLSNTS